MEVMISSNFKIKGAHSPVIRLTPKKNGQTSDIDVGVPTVEVIDLRHVYLPPVHIPSVYRRLSRSNSPQLATMKERTKIE